MTHEPELPPSVDASCAKTASRGVSLEHGAFLMTGPGSDAKNAPGCSRLTKKISPKIRRVASASL